MLRASPVGPRYAHCLALLDSNLFEGSHLPQHDLFGLSHWFSRFYDLNLVVGEGFEPSKSVTADLQSAPFGRSGTPPDCMYLMVPAAGIELATY